MGGPVGTLARRTAVARNLAATAAEDGLIGDAAGLAADATGDAFIAVKGSEVGLRRLIGDGMALHAVR